VLPHRSPSNQVRNVVDGRTEPRRPSTDWTTGRLGTKTVPKHSNHVILNLIQDRHDVVLSETELIRRSTASANSARFVYNLSCRIQYSSVGRLCIARQSVVDDEVFRRLQGHTGNCPRNMRVPARVLVCLRKPCWQGVRASARNGSAASVHSGDKRAAPGRIRTSSVRARRNASGRPVLCVHRRAGTRNCRGVAQISRRQLRQHQH